MARQLALIGVIFFSAMAVNSRAQQQTVYKQQLIWYGWFETLQLNERWQIQTEIQERHFVNPLAQHQFLVRAHVHRLLGAKGWEASAGFCTFFHNPNRPGTSPPLTIPELRPHAELAYRHQHGKAVFDHRFRTEARFFHHTNQSADALEDGFGFSAFRFRYRIQLLYPLYEKRYTFKLKLSNEYLLQAGGETGKPAFDQNRIYAGLTMQFTPQLSFDLGYMYWYQHRAPASVYSRHILRFTVFHRMKWGKSA